MTKVYVIVKAYWETSLEETVENVEKVFFSYPKAYRYASEQNDWQAKNMGKVLYRLEEYAVE